MFSSFLEMARREIIQQGDKVLMYEKECLEWIAKNPNCCGCPSELGCLKTMKLYSIIKYVLCYKPAYPQCPLELKWMRAYYQENIRQILKIKKVEELRLVLEP